MQQGPGLLLYCMTWPYGLTLTVPSNVNAIGYKLDYHDLTTFRMAIFFIFIFFYMCITVWYYG